MNDTAYPRGAGQVPWRACMKGSIYMGAAAHNSLSIGIRDDVILIIAEGEIRAGETFALNDYLLPYVESGGLKKTYVDLSRCEYMDSTFIGFIVALTKKCREKTCDIIRIVNPSEKAKTALRKLSTLNEIEVSDAAPVKDIPVFRLASQRGSFESKKNIELVFEAHLALSGLSEENRREFQALLDELKKVLEGS